VTAKAIQIMDIPTNIPLTIGGYNSGGNIALPECLEIRGEVCISKSDFIALNSRRELLNDTGLRDSLILLLRKIGSCGSLHIQCTAYYQLHLH
jgi:NAD-dependent DNA ligase